MKTFRGMPLVVLAVAVLVSTLIATVYQMLGNGGEGLIAPARVVVAPAEEGKAPAGEVTRETVR